MQNPAIYSNGPGSQPHFFARPSNLIAFASRRLALILAALIFILVASSRAATVQVQVKGGSDPSFSPSNVTIQPGDTVQWVWAVTDTHNVTSGPEGKADGMFASPTMDNGSFSFTFNTPGSFPYYCSIHFACCGMSGVVNVAGSTPTPTPSGAAQLLNISTRLGVETADNVLIGGFIITGTANKKILVRGLGPSLAEAGVSGPLADPFLELHKTDGTLLASNDNWKDTQAADIMATTIPPTNDFESAIVTTLAANSAGYTAVLKGTGGGTGIGLVEVYDLDQSADSKLANISTRGLAGTGSSVMIGGFILGNGTGAARVLVRGIGPSLTQAGVSGALTDPTLELRDSNGVLVKSNDNWKDTQQSDIQATGAAPSNDAESAIVATIGPAHYTAIVAGKAAAAGVALVEVFNLP